jgi:hypothetical protein
MPGRGRFGAIRTLLFNTEAAMAKFTVRPDGKLSFGAAVVAGIWLSIFSGPFTTAHAQYQGTPEMQQACTPDVMRLCDAEVPDVARIAVCMKRNRANLSPACSAAAFGAGNHHKRLRH